MRLDVGVASRGLAFRPNPHVHLINHMKTRAASHSSSGSRSRSRGGAKSSRSNTFRVSRAKAPKAGRAGKRKTAQIGRNAEITIDHEEIRHWAEDRGGIPAIVKRTHRKGAPAVREGILRIEFPGFGSDQKLEHVSWNEWFEVFDERELAFLCQKRKADGEQSTFNKLVNRSELA